MEQLDWKHLTPEAFQRAQVREFKGQLAGLIISHKVLEDCREQLRLIDDAYFSVSAVSTGESIEIKGEQVNYKTPGRGDPYATPTSSIEAYEKSREPYLRRIAECQAMISYVNKMLDKIETETRGYVIAKYVYGKTWQQVSKGKFADLSGIRKNVERSLFGLFAIVQKRTD